VQGLALLLWLLLTSVPRPSLGYSLVPPSPGPVQISPGKSIRFPLIAATSTTTGLLPRAFGMLCYLDLLSQPPYVVPVRRYQLLQSGFLQTPDRSGRLCRLLMGFGNLPIRDFHPPEIFGIFIPSRMPMPGTHKGLLSMPPNSQPANPTHGGTAASQPFYPIKEVERSELQGGY
jgi:hypothetical protein